MEIILGKTAGFCYGVKRAVDGSLKELNDNENMYCLGEIVHNKQVVYDLIEKGMNFIETIEEAPNNSKVIIRAHGIPREVYEIAKKRNIELIDYTCPKVIKVHEIAEEYANKGFYVFFVCSTKTHPEVIGTKSFCGDHCVLLEKAEDIEKLIEELKESKIKKIALISQTTYSMKKFNDIETKIKEILPKDIKLVVKNTICYATQARQEETAKLSQEVDKMIIIGGKNSSNTQKLYEVAKQNCVHSICIETKDELKEMNFSNAEKIGVMAGASTPQNVIDDVIQFLENIDKLIFI